MTLHIITRPESNSTSIRDCLSVANTGDAILFIEDGVYCLLDSALLNDIEKAHIQTYYLSQDVKARGLCPSSTSKPVDYDEFVELTVAHTASQTWS